MNAPAKALDFADVANDSAIRDSIAAAPPSATLPFGYHIKKGGLWYDDGGENGALLICGQIDVLAQTRDDRGEAWGRLLQWKDDDGRVHRWAMPLALLAGDGNEVRTTLLDRGLYLNPAQKAKSKVLDFLAMVKTPVRARAVDRVGWTDGAFALPDRTLGEKPDHLVIYQGSAAGDHQYRENGDLKLWQDRVARFGVGNSRIALALSAAFVGPLLSLIGEEGGGLNLRGPSSIGKSTALVAAASAWGPAGFVRQWRATSNGLEGVAVQHNETLLCLDELGQLDGKEAGSVAYMLANGMGKARAGRSGALRSPTQWKVMFLSSGEISLGDVAGRDGRGTRRSAAGQEIRILDVEADAGKGLGLFEHLHGVASAELLSRTIKEGAAVAHGVAGPAFVERVASNPDTVAAALRKGIDGFVTTNLPSGANGQVARACRRFGVIATAGEFAARAGVLPWAHGEAVKAAATVFAAWLDGRGGSGAAEDREAISKVRAFLEAHGRSRFEQLDREYPEGEQRIINRAGFWQTVDGLHEYLILPEAWRGEVCAGMDARRVAQVLGERGMLRTDAAGKYSIARNLPGLGKARVYVVTPAIFGGEDA